MKYFYQILICILFFSCSKNNTESPISELSKTIEKENFDSIDKLKGKKMDLGLLLSPVELFFHDSLLFVSQINQDFNLSVFTPSNSKKVGEIVPNGMGPNELLSVADILFLPDNSIWLHDIVTSSLKNIEIELLKTDSISIQTNNFITPKLPVYTVGIIDDKIFATTPDINPLSRFQVFNFNGEKIGYAGDYPNYGIPLDPTVLVEVFWPISTTHPHLKKNLLAYQYLDLIEIFGTEGELITRIHGPQQFLPEFETGIRGNYPNMIRKYNKTRYAFRSISSNEDLVFLLYDEGKTHSKEEGEKAIHYSTIVSIDWEGNPKAYYELDHPVTSIAVDWNDHIIYGLDRIESEVYSFKF